LFPEKVNSTMRRANGPDELLYSLIELRPGDARRRFRKSIFEDYPLRGPIGQCACAYCGRWDQKLTIDHIVPKSKGGPHFAKYNLVPSCQACNLLKGADPIFEWWRPQRFWNEKREELLLAWVHHNSFVSAHTSLQDIEAFAEERDYYIPPSKEEAPISGGFCYTEWQAA
jgi:hypothetical protein